MKELEHNVELAGWQKSGVKAAELMMEGLNRQAVKRNQV
jgi:hypothetical protein